MPHGDLAYPSASVDLGKSPGSAPQQHGSNVSAVAFLATVVPGDAGFCTWYFLLEGWKGQKGHL